MNNDQLQQQAQETYNDLFTDERSPTSKILSALEKAYKEGVNDCWVRWKEQPKAEPWTDERVYPWTWTCDDNPDSDGWTTIKDRKGEFIAKMPHALAQEICRKQQASVVRAAQLEAAHNATLQQSKSDDTKRLDWYLKWVKGFPVALPRTREAIDAAMKENAQPHSQTVSD